MLSLVQSVVFLAGPVQSVITSLTTCAYFSSDASCNYAVICLDYCEQTDYCKFVTCEDYLETSGEPLDECYTTPDGLDQVVTCVEDGTEPDTCENYGICKELCPGEDGTCEGNCVTVGTSVTAIGYEDCDSLYAAAPDGFEEWGTCFLNQSSNISTIVTCNAANPSAGDSTGTEPSDESDRTGTELPATVPASCQNYDVCVTTCPGSGSCEDDDCLST